MKNILGVEFPGYIEGLGDLKAFDGKRHGGTVFEESLKAPNGRNNKMVESLEKAIEMSGLKDGMDLH